MPAFNGNNYYVEIDGTAMCAEVITVEPSFGGNTQDATHGCNATHVKRLPGLRDNTFTVTITFPNGTTQAYLAALRAQTEVVLEYGPEGNTVGKPKHVQACIIDSLDGITQGSEKPVVTATINLSGSDEPTVDLQNGGVY